MTAATTFPGQADPASGYCNDWRYTDIESAATRLETTGFTAIEAEFSPHLLSVLRAEAAAKAQNAVPVSGTPQCRYHARLADLGEEGMAFLAGGRLSKLLDDLFGISLRPSPGASCYTYYRPGDSLGPHLDHPELCIVTVILYLDVLHPAARPAETGLALHILGSAGPGADRLRAILPTETGTLIIGRGATNWHERPTLQDGEYLTALTACCSRAVST